MREGGVKLAGSRGEKKAAQCRPCRGGKKTHARARTHTVPLGGVVEVVNGCLREEEACACVCVRARM